MKSESSRGLEWFENENENEFILSKNEVMNKMFLNCGMDQA